MHRKAYLSLGLCCVGLFSAVCSAESEMAVVSSSQNQHLTITERISRQVEPLKQLSHLTVQDLKVDAKADQPEEVKDPLQPLNRQIFAVNEKFDQALAKPLAIQYNEKVPEQVRGSYRAFRKNLNEPWNMVNQLVQGRPKVAAQTLARFSLNTLTTLGMADPAQRFGLLREDESLAMTLGYYGVPSGAYLVLPFLGPSSLRDAAGMLVDSQAKPQKYLLDDGWYFTDLTLGVLDTRAQLLALEDALQGDRYTAMRDIYLQRQQFVLAEKLGKTAELEFIESEIEDFTEDGVDSEAVP